MTRLLPILALLAVLCIPARAQVAFQDSVTSGSGNATPTRTFAHTVTNGTFLVVTTCHRGGGSDTVTGVTYDGIAMSLGHEMAFATPDLYASFWHLPSPATGSNNVIVTASDTVDGMITTAINFSGVDASSPWGTFVENSSTNASSSSVEVTTESGEIVLDILCKEGNGATGTVGADQTSRWAVNDAGTSIRDSSGSTQAGADGGVMSWTSLPTFTDFLHFAGPLNQSSTSIPVLSHVMSKKK